jgi:CIC family chloride channel protein
MITRRTREILLTVLCGAAGCLAVLAFGKGINSLYSILWTPLENGGIWLFAGGGFIVLSAAGLLTGAMIAFLAPDAAGSGIPQLKVAYWKEMGLIRKRTVIVKFLAGIISIGGGMSLGKEGPAVQLAAGVASIMAQKLGAINLQSRAMTACGAAAGLAAAFNTPIAGVSFVLEEILENLNSRLIGRLLLASFVSVFVLYLAIGDHAVLGLHHAIHFYWRSYLMVPLVSAIAALVGVAFQNAALGWRRQIRRQAMIPLALRPFVGALVTWVAATVVFAATGHDGVLGLGYADLNACLAGSLGLVVVFLLLLGKWAATTASYAWGGCGGIFAPTLCLGAFAGSLCGGVAVTFFHLSHGIVELLAVVGMSACLGAVVRAPVTSIMIVFEMTHDFDLVPPLMLGALVSQFVSRRCCRENFYSQVIEDDGVDLSLYRTAHDFADWKNRRVVAFATMPAHCLRLNDAKAARETFRETQFLGYPVIGTSGEGLCGVISRDECLRALEAHREWKMHPAATVFLGATLGEAAKLLVEAPLGILVILDQSGGVCGVFTLHDLLRCQLAVMDAE